MSWSACPVSLPTGQKLEHPAVRVGLDATDDLICTRADRGGARTPQGCEVLGSEETYYREESDASCT